jgi:hypothetical protein
MGFLMNHPLDDASDLLRRAADEYRRFSTALLGRNGAAGPDVSTQATRL